MVEFKASSHGAISSFLLLVLTITLGGCGGGGDVTTTTTTASVTTTTTTTTPQAITPSCEYSVVGGGWAGVYAAWRLVVDAGKVPGKSVCIFEAMSRAGGRTLTAKNDQGLMVDVGAMRYSEDMHLPADLIAGPLDIKSTCFAPSCPKDPTRGNRTLLKLVDSNKQNVGFAAPILKMLKQLSLAGATIVYNARLSKIEDLSGSNCTACISLGFEGGKVFRAKSVVLNLPRNALLNLTDTSAIFTEAPGGAKEAQDRIGCADNSPMGRKEYAVKAYLSYTDAWWLTKLNLTEGRRVNKSNSSSHPLVQVRYHGATTVQCSSAQVCHGALEVVDDFELESPGLSWYLQFQEDLLDAFGRFGASSPAAVALHSKVMAMHAEDLLAASVNPKDIAPPTELLVGFWRADAILQSCPHLFQVGADPATYPCLKGEPPATFLDKLQKPAPNLNIFIANNDFWYSPEFHDGDWAQSSLISVERVLFQYFQLPAPTWLDSKYYASEVLRNSTSLLLV
jgi:hypothetical protein